MKYYIIHAFFISNKLRNLPYVSYDVIADGLYKMKLYIHHEVITNRKTAI